MGNEFSPGRVYAIAFQSPDRERGIHYPEIVFAVRKDNAPRLEEYVRTCPAHLNEDGSEYLPEVEALWSDPQLTLDVGFDRYFGFGSCGYVLEGDQETEYRFPLVPEKQREIVLTLNYLFRFNYHVSGDEDAELSTNSKQLLTLVTRCENRAMGWGHMVGGDAYPALRRWLYQLANSGTKDPLSQVREAMQMVCVTLWPEVAELMLDMCDARLASDGRFMLECPGNACDVSIYPDLDFGPESDLQSTISCHNLDSATQQLILLSGLAALHGLASAELG